VGRGDTVFSKRPVSPNLIATSVLAKDLIATHIFVQNPNHTKVKFFAKSAAGNNLKAARSPRGRGERCCL
jgi:hypothetical protein